MSNPTRTTSKASTAGKSTHEPDTDEGNTVKAKALEALRKACQDADSRAQKLTVAIVKAYQSALAAGVGRKIAQDTIATHAPTLRVSPASLDALPLAAVLVDKFGMTMEDGQTTAVALRKDLGVKEAALTVESLASRGVDAAGVVKHTRLVTAKANKARKAKADEARIENATAPDDAPAAPKL